jgi:hypothetical protein
MKKQIILIAAFFMLTFVSFAQVGVGNTNPLTTLEVTGANAGGVLTSTDGVTVPRVSTDMTAAPAAGTLVGQLVYSTNAASTGFYYWNGSAWTKLGAAATTPAFTFVLLQAASTAYDWSTYYNYFEFTSGTQLTLPLPNNPLYTGKSIHIRNRTGGNLGFQGTDGVGTPRGIASISATSSIEVFSDGTTWHLITGRN